MVNRALFKWKETDIISAGNIPFLEVQTFHSNVNRERYIHYSRNNHLRLAAVFLFLLAGHIDNKQLSFYHLSHTILHVLVTELNQVTVPYLLD